MYNIIRATVRRWIDDSLYKKIIPGFLETWIGKRRNKLGNIQVKGHKDKHE